MTERFDCIVIGGGSAGLTAAGGIAMFGRKVALIEAGAMGGECLNTGCVPSKALIAAAAVAQQARDGGRFGIQASPVVNWTGVRAHIDGAIAAIAPHDSQERFEGMGVTVLRTRARFLDGGTVLAGNSRLTAPRIVIATGSAPAVPPIEGLDHTPFLTNETVFGLDVLPSHLLVLGAGAIGMELAQAFRRLGAEVTVIDPGRPLAHEDPEAAALVVAWLSAEGVRFEEGRKPTGAALENGSVVLTLDDGRRLSGSHLLVATGRRPRTDDLDLAAAGVETGKDGIVVDPRRRTSNKRIYAIGDCRSGPRFTHVAGYEGSLVALAVALGWSGKVDWRALPRVTYTHPELAQIGLTEAEARDQRDGVDVTREDFAANDRAVTDGQAKGFLKLIRVGGKVVGVTIVGTGAGDLLPPWSQIINGKASSFALGAAMIAYPTRSEISKAAAFAVHAPTVFGAVPKGWAALVGRKRQWLG